jgi:hypothetical protein
MFIFNLAIKNKKYVHKTYLLYLPPENNVPRSALNLYSRENKP